MHGLVNRSIQCFVRDTYGAEAWSGICREANLGFDNFEAMLIYDDSQTETVLTAACARFDRSRAAFLEDMGTYLVTSPGLGALRRLLRFGGDTFTEFLHTLDDLQDRMHLALPELDAPSLELTEHAIGTYCLRYRWSHAGFGAMILGILRAMADDYGALVVLEHRPEKRGGEDCGRIPIRLLDAKFAEGHEFAFGVAG
ncbi:MAG: heme NO-binding domain-containing protein [Paracoccaceae bacterium]